MTASSRVCSSDRASGSLLLRGSAIFRPQNPSSESGRQK
eukprot:CAMPEP_0172087972 /NCGR_PEP_ID=MMETSP1043-20130122/22982_1 /TAXON_ID=464988 /ORGANISM="Hemiselmis andersenii, Strain CCMP441" /LENGTH=38 /DNA_ID= /DNA_START= /DNA_END= /DNA_ORIENTATION=